MSRFLVLSESLPFPTGKGGDLRVWQHLNALASIDDAGIFGLCSNDRRRETPPGLPLTCWTTSTDPALAYPPPANAALQARAWLLDPDGHPSDLYFSEVAARELDVVLAAQRPDVVVVETPWLYRYINRLRAEKVRIILDCHNVEADVAEQVAAARTGNRLDDRVIRDVLPVRTAMIERRAIDAVDQIWVCSEIDRARLARRYPTATPVAIIPNTVQTSAYDPARVEWRHAAHGAHPLTLIYAGVFAYIPNAIAAAFLIDEVMPRFPREIDWRLHLVGPMPTPDMRAAARADARIVVSSAVPDVRPALSTATASVVPLFQGGGTRLKILESFAAGIPVVSSAKGVEGLRAEAGTHYLAADTADGFVEAVLSIHRDRTLAEHLATNARRLVEREYSWTQASRCMQEAVLQLGLEP